MRFESAVTSVSWIPSAAITGVTKAPLELGVTHYDDPPPDSLHDLESVVGPEGARFANELSTIIMRHGGVSPKPHKMRGGEALFVELADVHRREENG